MPVINENDFRKLDLNLLLVLHVLLQERNVTRAAARLFIGQPALSGALRRLRQVFGDDLFVRTSHGMVPTPRALDLGQQIEPLLFTVQQALQQQPGFAPASAQRVFRIGLSDALEVALLPGIMQRINAQAPGVQIIAINADGQNAVQLLDAGEIELAIGVFLQRPAWLQASALFNWKFQCVYNPAQLPLSGGRISLEDYLAWPHVLTSFNGELQGVMDDDLANLGRQRRVILSSRHFGASPLLVQQMAALTTVPSFVAQAWQQALRLAICELPFEVPEYEVSQMWPATHAQDAGLIWLRQVVAQSCAAKA
ncbi:LysR family transcriptional regulator [Amantichitinum ursilacus]|uniref:Nodulation protein D 2 n=1 Tax=Amantichitinum ursilacus TaxID=857265 RepID=A0A0N0GQF7_9NEIS|nr:LysR family transcriptional regulator [Amantichitinum ursilacus]KPC54643.1 Nodulation protein D 2 [Amantichitinum ursilacus]